MSQNTDSTKLSLYEYDKQIAAAFKIDCEEFLEEFEKLKSLRYADFAKVWQLKNFTFVFAGQKYALLLKELCENFFYIAKKFIMTSESIFTQIGGFYFLYGLYYKQPLKSWVKIRLTLEEYKKIIELIENVKLQGQFEPLYIFSKMKVDQAFIYTALPRPLGPEPRFVKGYQWYLDYTFTLSRKEETFVKFYEVVKDSDLVRDLEKTNSEYQELLSKYAAKSPGLIPFSSNIMKDLQEAYSVVEKEASTSKNIQPPPEFSEVNKQRSRVRKKAMKSKNAVYRGNRKVKTAIEIDFGEEVSDNISDFDDES